MWYQVLVNNSKMLANPNREATFKKMTLGRPAYLTEEKVSRQETSEAFSIPGRKNRWHAQIFTSEGYSN
jgi:hypothetical protein